MYDNDGNLIWAKGFGSTGNDTGNSITTDSYGNLYHTGAFNNSIVLGVNEVNETTLTSNGGFDIYIAKYASSWVEPTDCPLNFAYWKKNENEFPANAIPMTLGTSNTYSASQLTNLLNAAPGGDVSILLARQLISAKLNIANGSPVPEGLLDLLADADNAIGTASLPMNVKANTSLGKTMQNLTNSIAKYNNGQLTPDCEIPENSIYHDEEFLADYDYEGVTSVDEFNLAGFRLSQNYPNPVTNSTSIEFYLPVSSNISIEIFNILGENVSTLVSGNTYDAGSHQVYVSTQSLQAGSYFYRITAGNYTQTKVMQIIR